MTSRQTHTSFALAYPLADSIFQGSDKPPPSPGQAPNARRRDPPRTPGLSYHQVHGFHLPFPQWTASSYRCSTHHRCRHLDFSSAALPGLSPQIIGSCLESSSSSRSFSGNAASSSARVVTFFLVILVGTTYNDYLKARCQRPSRPRASSLTARFAS
jgi:hypothetical protein